MKLYTKLSSGGKKRFYTVVVDGKEMDLKEFSEKIGVHSTTVQGWASHGIFEQRLQDRGIL